MRAGSLWSREGNSGGRGFFQTGGNVLFRGAGLTGAPAAAELIEVRQCAEERDGGEHEGHLRERDRRALEVEAAAGAGAAEQGQELIPMGADGGGGDQERRHFQEGVGDLFAGGDGPVRRGEPEVAQDGELVDQGAGDHQAQNAGVDFEKHGGQHDGAGFGHHQRVDQGFFETAGGFDAGAPVPEVIDESRAQPHGKDEVGGKAAHGTGAG